MRKSFALPLVVLSATLAAAAPVRQAGEWEVTLNNGQPRLVCYLKDETLDENTLSRVMSRVAGSGCTVSQLETAGNVTTFASQCTLNGATISSTGTITQTGPDSFTSKVHSLAATMKLPDGKIFNMPATDIVNVSRRLGPCKPGDHQIPQ